MENYAKKLAINHKIINHSSSKFFPIKKLLNDFKYIGLTYDILNESITKEVPIPPSGEWILDNYYLIEEQVNSLKHSLTLSKYKKLPSVNGVSRIYIIAKEIIKYTDGNITENTVETFIRAYQTKKSISMDELWLLPTMLKIGLIEYIKELCEKITSAQLQKFKVESLVERLIKNKPTGEQKFHKYKSIILETEATPYVEYLIFCLKKFGKEGIQYIQILEEEIKKVGTTTNDVIKVEHYDLAVRRVSMANCITSIRHISRLNFVNLFERINSIENILSMDEIYTKMELDTRNMYRNEIKMLAKKSSTSEVYVAQKLIEIATEHIGSYLFGSHKAELWKALGIQKAEQKQSLNMKTFEYIVAIYLPTILFSFLIAKKNFILALIPISEIFTLLINKILTKCNKPQLLPRMEKIADDVNTFVVVPTILTSKDRVKELMQSIERYYLGNKMDNIYFALLGDASETDKEVMPYDSEVIQTGIEEAKKLNIKYGKQIFFFLYRKRLYNEKQQKWLGYERKRGMLVEFNRLLLTGDAGTFQTNTIEKEILNKKIKYVITLDADTELILDSAKKLIGIMEHPLNKPIIKNGIVVEGYGIVQPRVGISIESSTKNIFSKIFAGSGGLDLYSTAESNVYQDTFGEAIFTGKGIYNIEVFEKVLKDQIPENTVLSHDLLEGSYVRCGLASDVEVIDGFPNMVNSYMIRQQRWTRGDWQIIKWLFHGPLNCLSKYKIFDNIRRSLIDISLLVLFFRGFYLLPLMIIFFPFILDIIDVIYNKIKNVFVQNEDNIIIKNKNYLPIISGIKGSLYRCSLELIFLPYKAILLFESIVVTLYRMFISKKHLLEWLTAADAEKVLGKDLKSFIKEMIISPLIGFALIETSLIYNRISIEATFSLFIIWFLTPYISYAISVNRTMSDLDKETRGQQVEYSTEHQILIEIAKRTWNYFNDYMIEKYNYLPPDNYQNKRKELIAPRTSSTNIGLGLLTIISAKDLGFISEEEMINKLAKSISTIDSLEKWKGHLYNWYNIETKEILQPGFISTVDSGNFVGYLYVTLQALKECTDTSKTTHMVQTIERIIKETDFSALYDVQKSLFSIGFDKKENKLIDSYYDLLASEARLASFVAMAKRDVPYKHWFGLGRTLTTLDKHKGLVSWAGTMFEYFMPYIVMKNFQYTLMDETYEFCIYCQKKYARKLNIPWGISESAFYLQDLNYNYQYKAFGIPWLGVKRGLKEEVVVSPYSSLMTIDKNEKDVLKNIQELKKAGAYSKYGFYDAVDYTPNRVGKKRKAVVKTYMAHHQALILLSINNFLNNNILKNRFSKNQEIRTIEILLQERVPQNTIFTKKKKEKIEVLKYKDYEEYSERIIEKPSGFMNLLSNDRYTLLINDNGEGYSICDGNMISRFKEIFKNGNFIILKDIKNNFSWTNMKYPNYKIPEKYHVEFSPSMCKYTRSDEGIETTTKIVISPEDNVEIRSISIMNQRQENAILDVISYLESPLCNKKDDISHMAFQNLFLEASRYNDACILRRKNRGSGSHDKYLIHFAFTEDNENKFDFETDKCKIIGSGNNITNADIAYKDKVYSNEIFPNLNTVISYKTNLKFESNEKKVIHYIYGYANSVEECIKIYEKYHNIEMLNRVYELAYSRSIVENRFLGYKFKNINHYNDMVGQIINGSNTRKKYEKEIMNNQLRQKDLWKFGISGDLPIIMLKIKNVNETEILKQFVDFAEYLGHKNLKIDFIIANEEENSYEEYTKEKIYEIINSRNANYLLNKNGGIHVIKKVQITDDEMNLLYACSDMILDAHIGLLEEQIYEV